ncbi:uncharacterized protein LOC129457156 [Periophthalmus magnuspinnatus]|uniref:uncharacterized protein LOC129457156 n=1 Tax=Periophthalmus magnuspinnatus TaxID=409849 RepID=UPI00243686B4|nr:uncharacterized protein LOC129457156 [Periophthalmus magnuspinnatus]
METAPGRSSGRVTTRTNFALDEDEERPFTAENSEEPPATPGVSRGGGGGSEEEEHNASTSAELLYPVNTEQFTAADWSPWLRFAPAAGMSSGPSDKPSSSDFSSRAVLCLIEAVGRLWGLYDTWERSQLFQNVQEEMAAEGHVHPVEKIRRKWNNLIVTYKRVKERGRDMGHAKTSWEFFDLMEATLSDTVGSQINNKRTKLSNPPPGPVTKVVVKPHLPQTAAQTPDVASGLQSTAGNASPSSNTAPSGNVDLNNAHRITHKAPPTGILPLRLRSAQTNRNTSNACRWSAASVSLAPSSGAENEGGGDEEEQSATASVMEVLKRQEEQADVDRVERRRAEKRRERREQRMVESLGRAATALELLSSKQDTVIALLQRLADKH